MTPGGDPVMIRVPKIVVEYLKPGDTIDAKFAKAKENKYLVIQMFIGLDSGTEKFDNHKLYWMTGSDEKMDLGIGGLGLSEKNEKQEKTVPEKTLTEKVKEFRSSAGYKKRKAELMKKAPPEDHLFPEETYNEEWFAARETDIGSDDEVGMTAWGEDKFEERLL